MEITLPHRLELNERKLLNLSGTTEVISFDEGAVVLKTELGQLTVHGKNLQLKSLTPEGGQVTVEGQIDAMIYEDPRPSGGLRRLFR